MSKLGDLENIAISFSQQTGYPLQDLLGRGKNGIAYLTKDEMVIKVTGDKSEYVESKKLLNKSPKHLAKIYDCFIVESQKIENDYWVIVLEKVYHNRKEQESLWVALEGVLEVKFGADSLEGFLQFYKVGQIDKNQLKNISNYLINLKTTKYYFYFLQLIEMIDEMNSLNIKSVDYGPSNFGFRGNTLVYFDLGFGDEEYSGDHKILKF